MADEIAEIRARIDIVELIGQTVSLKRAGSSFKGLCPFHQDRNPSFSVTPQTGHYRCWSCGEHGDIFTWVEKTQNVTFVEALQLLAEKAGVELRRTRKEDKSARMNQRGAMEAALAYFRESLPKSKEATEYCRSRDLGQDLLEKWEIGYAPEEGLAIRLQKQGFRLAECRELFLLEGDETRGYGDKFKGRLMFPIRDERGDLVAFGGRIIGQGQPKYINSSDTPLYKKGKVLYGMNIAKESMRSERKAVLVEGFLDVVACHAAGVATAVASLGTALSQDHAKLLKRWCEGVVVLYDSDAAGRKAADRAAEILLEEGLQVRVALVPEGKDPDTMLRNVGPEAVRKAAETGVTPLEYKIESLRNQFPLEQDQFWTAAVQVLAKEPSELERARIIEDLAPKYPRIRDKTAAREALRKMVAQGASPTAAVRVPPRSADSPGASGQEMARSLHSTEASFFRGLFDEKLRAELWPLLHEEDLFLTKTGTRLAQELRAPFPLHPPEGPTSVWIAQIESQKARLILASIEADVRLGPALQEVRDAVERMRLKQNERRVADLKRAGITANEELAEIQARLKHKT